MKINTTKMRDTILKLVKNDPRCANDDKLLIAKVWWTEGWHDKKLYEHIKTVSTPESITRARRKLVEEGLITPSEEAQRSRRENEEQVKIDLGY